MPGPGFRRGAAENGRRFEAINWRQRGVPWTLHKSSKYGTNVSRSSSDSNQITRDGLFLDVLQTTNHTLETINHALETINHVLETINHVLEKCEYEIFYSKQKLT